MDNAARRFHFVRTNAGLSYRAVAELMGIPIQSVQALEEGCLPENVEQLKWLIANDRRVKDLVDFSKDESLNQTHE